MSGEWEERVREELEELEELWDEYKERELLPVVREARALGTKDALDNAVNIEVYIEGVEALFAEAREELETEIDAAERGVNAAIAAQRVAEALEMLRIYAKGWREERGGLG
jgi:5'-deoxynucleotidase YfbR-like HD superfamily hydrolase